MKKKAKIFWCTGMSGSGKSTLVEYVREQLEKKKLSILVLDGDEIRQKSSFRLSYNRKDVEKNNLNIASYCADERFNFDVIFVPVISPIDSVRKQIRKMLAPNFNLIYMKTDIESLISRDPKGLYKKASNGEIIDLIGFSDHNPYDDPEDYDYSINTSSLFDINKSKDLFLKYVLEEISNLSN